MPVFQFKLNFYYYAVTMTIIVIATTLLTLIYGLRSLKKQPATLLLPKAPKAGKKVILERIPFIWNALSFKYKSTFRNVLLFKSRFLMTVVSIIGSTVLVFSGLGLMDCSVNMENGESLITISVALVIFSALLCALVIYNLTNINVSERTREIATLMVLGYNNNEVTGYINREVYIMGIIGALLGIPFGIIFIEFVFDLVSIGTLSEINWWTYVITPLTTLLFTFLSTLLLRKKILSTDMNTSLKTID
jgi:putative ABC transport system permease protein